MQALALNRIKTLSKNNMDEFSRKTNTTTPVVFFGVLLLLKQYNNLHNYQAVK